MAGNVPFPANDWTRARRAIAGAFKWPREFADHDLRYWADPKACEGRKRPSYGQLAADWGCSKSTVKQWIDAFNNRTPAERTPNASRTAIERQSNDGAALDADNREGAERQSNTERTLIEQQSNAGRTAPKGTRAVPSPSPSPSLEQESVLKAYRSYQATWSRPPKRKGALKATKPKGQTKTDGEALYRLISKPETAERTVQVLQWLSKSDHHRAEGYRHDCRKLITVWRWLDSLWEDAQDFPVGEQRTNGDSPEAMVARVWDLCRTGKLSKACRADEQLRKCVEGAGGVNRVRMSTDFTRRQVHADLLQAARGL